MDSTSDEAFDAFWEEEARNPHRNRIRIGRTYQATIPPKLKPGEGDGRKLEELETIYWHKQSTHKDDEFNEYFAVAKVVSLYTRFKKHEKSKSELINGTDHQSESSISNNGLSAKSVPNGCEESTLSLNQHLAEIFKFVSSHHPPLKDEGCSSSSLAATLQKEEWSVKEARLFASALEVYGKNFGAIKKALPWKPAKSIIEHYYSSNDEGGSSDDDDDEDFKGPKGTQFLSAKSKNFQTLQVGSCFTSSRSLFNGDDLSLKNLTENEDPIVGQEVKAIKAKPKRNQTMETMNGNSLLGSLKFFMDGQLVLKLNAKQEEVNKKCQWVESLDTPKIPRPPLKKKTRHFKELESSRCSIRSEDTGDDESSDDDSLGSNETRSLPSPSQFPRFRSSKVKVENNCHVPLSSTFFAPTTKDEFRFKHDQKRHPNTIEIALPEEDKRGNKRPKIGGNEAEYKSAKTLRVWSEPSSPRDENTVVDLSVRSCSASQDISSPQSNHVNEDGNKKKESDSPRSHQSSIGNSPGDFKGPNWLQSYLPFYEQYYRYCSQTEGSPTNSRRAAQSVSPPSTIDPPVEVPSRPRSATSSSSPSPSKEQKKNEWKKRSPNK